jgi:hypothetical protein
MIANCPQCNQHFDLGERVGMKVGGTLLGAALGGSSRNVWVALAGAALGAWLGHELDKTILPECPSCRVVLQILNAAV